MPALAGSVQRRKLYWVLLLVTLSMVVLVTSVRFQLSGKLTYTGAFEVFSSDTNPAVFLRANTTVSEAGPSCSIPIIRLIGVLASVFWVEKRMRSTKPRPLKTAIERTAIVKCIRTCIRLLRDAADGRLKDKKPFVRLRGMIASYASWNTVDVERK